jgi:hypothetical protein
MSNYKQLKIGTYMKNTMKRNIVKLIDDMGELEPCFYITSIKKEQFEKLLADIKVKVDNEELEFFEVIEEIDVQLGKLDPKYKVITSEYEVHYSI